MVAKNFLATFSCISKKMRKNFFADLQAVFFWAGTKWGNYCGKKTPKNV